MFQFSLSNHKTGLLLVGLITVVTLALHYLQQQDQVASLHENRSQLRSQLEQSLFTQKAHTIESTFTDIYESIRIISLLPSIRSIEGGNRSSEAEDILATGRLSADGWNTVQQLYNNLVEHVSVSEIYATINGFSPQQGELPFFMFDQAILAGGSDASEHLFTLPSDFPEEAEEAEYQALAEQLQTVQQEYPRFSFDALEQIPAFSTPSLRTCDNTQYLSTTRDDVQDSHGFIYSLPFYTDAGVFSGVISAILRLNVLEALLMGLPFVPVTPEDQSVAQQIQLSMPEHPIPFVLYNQTHELYITDRRNPELIEMVQSSNIESDPHWIHRTLDIKDASSWQLAYHIPTHQIAAAAAHQQELYGFKLAALWGLSGCCFS